jgi:uncharacterized protein YbcI
MSVPNEGQRPDGQSLTAVISSRVVGIIREYTGRGPTKARTSIRDNVIVVMLEDTLTKGERALVASGRAEKVLDIRKEFQDAMRDDCMATVSQLTGRRVIAMMSSNHIDPDLAAELFVLNGAVQGAQEDGAST